MPSDLPTFQSNMGVPPDGDARPTRPGSSPGERPDPPPQPPEPPLPAECCESGCERCVYDLYTEDLDYYRTQLAAWRERNPGREPDAGR